MINLHVLSLSLLKLWKMETHCKIYANEILRVKVEKRKNRLEQFNESIPNICDLGLWSGTVCFFFVFVVFAMYNIPSNVLRGIFREVKKRNVHFVMTAWGGRSGSLGYVLFTWHLFTATQLPFLKPSYDDSLQKTVKSMIVTVLYSSSIFICLELWRNICILFIGSAERNII